MYSLKGGLHSHNIHFLGVVFFIVLLILDDFPVQQDKDLTHGYKEMGPFIPLQKRGGSAWFSHFVLHAGPPVVPSGKPT